MPSNFGKVLPVNGRTLLKTGCRANSTSSILSSSENAIVFDAVPQKIAHVHGEAVLWYRCSTCKIIKALYIFLLSSAKDSSKIVKNNNRNRYNYGKIGLSCNVYCRNLY